MRLYWLCYRHNNSIFVVIEPAHSLIYARLRASHAHGRLRPGFSCIKWSSVRTKRVKLLVYSLSRMLNA